MQYGSEAIVDAHGRYGVDRWVANSATREEETVAEEVPVALVYNGISHAVMMATPQDLRDFAVGFSLTEGIVADAGELYDVEVVEQALGVEVRIELASARFVALRERRRSMTGRTGCGLCGVESLQQVAGRRLAAVEAEANIDAVALQRAQDELHARQHLFQLTGAVHAAAWCRRDGAVELVREDVGRHNALDKLIGAIAARRQSFSDGFVLMTSRASYEIVQKAACVGIPIIAAVSAPTGMAVRVAEAAGVTLIGFARGERHCVYSHPQRIH